MGGVSVSREGWVLLGRIGLGGSSYIAEEGTVGGVSVSREGWVLRQTSNRISI